MCREGHTPFAVHPMALLPCPTCEGAGPTVCADTVPRQGLGIRPNRRHIPLILLLALAVLPLAEPAVTAPPQIEAKQAEAQQVLAQIQQMDADLSHVIEAFNAEQVELDRPWQVLEEAGYTVEAAANGKECYRETKKACFLAKAGPKKP